MGVRATTICDSCGAASAGQPNACAWCGAPLRPPPAPADVVAVLPGRLPREPVGRDIVVKTYCPHCGRLYPEAAGSCPKCLPLATDERGGACPRCGEALEPTLLGEAGGSQATPATPATVDRCASCGGTWFDVGEVERAVDLRTQGSMPRERIAAIREALARTAASAGRGGSVACVRCGARTTRRMVAPGAGILVDLCGPHGMWFDGGELAGFREFAAAGGLEILRHWEEETGPGRKFERRVRPWHRPGLSDDEAVPLALTVGLLVLAARAR